MRQDAGKLKVAGGQTISVRCHAKKDTLVTVWSETELGRAPYVPQSRNATYLDKGKPRIVKPLYRRFSGEWAFELTAPESMALVVVEELDTAEDYDETKLKVRIIAHGPIRKIISSFGRHCRNAIRLVRGSDDKAWYSAES